MAIRDRPARRAKHFLIYGWTVQYRVFEFLPINESFPVGMIIVYTPVEAYLINAPPAYASSATVGNMVS